MTHRARCIAPVHRAEERLLCGTTQPSRCSHLGSGLGRRDTRGRKTPTIAKRPRGNARRYKCKGRGPKALPPLKPLHVTDRAVTRSQTRVQPDSRARAHAGANKRIHSRLRCCWSSRQTPKVWLRNNPQRRAQLVKRPRGNDCERTRTTTKRPARFFSRSLH